MRIIATVLAISLLPACASTTGVVASNAGGKCVADTLQSFVGQKASAQLGNDLLNKSGGRTLRWGPPRSAMTMDYREDRLNVMYDDAMVIERINCG